MGQVLKLVNFLKVYPLCLLSSGTFFGFMYFLLKANNSDSEQMISTVATVVLLLAFFAFFAFQNKMISAQMIAELEEDESPDFADIKEGFKGYFLSTIGILIVFVAMYSFILPLIGGLAGGLFQMEIGGFEFNALTLIINLACITWTLLALAEVNTIEASFFDTFTFTFGFVFSNFAKVVGFIVSVIFAWGIFQFVLYSTATGNQMLMLPVKIFILAYLFGFINSYATYLFINNITEEDLSDDE